MKNVNIQKGITYISVILVLLHLSFPLLAIDIITVTLLFIAAIPWLSPLFKSIGLPGGVSAEFRDLNAVKEDIDHVGLLKPAHYGESFFMPNSSDPNLVLAWLRIEIEKRIRILSEKNSLGGDRSMQKMLRELENHGALSSEEVAVLLDLRNTLSRAIHGMDIDVRVGQWALNVGPQILSALDEKINKGVVSKT